MGNCLMATSGSGHSRRRRGASVLGEVRSSPGPGTSTPSGAGSRLCNECVSLIGARAQANSLRNRNNSWNSLTICQAPLRSAQCCGEQPTQHARKTETDRGIT